MDVIRILPIYDQVWETVNLQGDVRHPGDFQWRQDLKLKEIIQEGELLPTADLKRAEIIRLTDDYMDRKIITVNLDSLMEGDESQNILLRPKDLIRVYTLYREVDKVSVTGEVMSPGVYEVARGARLSDLLQRVGGFTSEAYPYGIVFKRKDVKNAEDKNLQIYISKMQSQVLQGAASAATEASSAENSRFRKSRVEHQPSILDNIKSMRELYEGRVAINITRDINQWAGSKDDLLLKNGDSIYIPKTPQEVFVMGEVHSPSAEVFLPGIKVKDYINQTGGLYQIRLKRTRCMFCKQTALPYSGDSPSIGNIENVKLNAGDTVFVPQKTERNVGMRSFKDIIDILFKTAVIVATLTVLHL